MKPNEVIDPLLAAGDPDKANGPVVTPVDKDINKPPADDPEAIAAAEAKAVLEKNAAEEVEVAAYAALSDEDKKIADTVKADKDAYDALSDEDKAAADKKVADAKSDAPLDKEVWGDTKSETGNAVLLMLQKAGVTPEDAKAIMFDAVVEGDMSKLDMPALTKHLGESQAFILQQGVQTFISDRDAAGKEALTKVHDVAGSEENWNKVRDWHNDPKNTPVAELEEFASVIEGGGKHAEYAIRDMIAAYEGNSENSTLSQEREETQSTSAPTLIPLSKVDYSDAYDKVYNNRTLSHKQRESQLSTIDQRRAAGRSIGI